MARVCLISISGTSTANWQAEGIGEETGPEMLFSLSKLKGKAGASLAADEDAAAPDFDDAADLATSSSGEEAGAAGAEDEEMDSDEEQRRWAVADKRAQCSDGVWGEGRAVQLGRLLGRSKQRCTGLSTAGHPAPLSC